MASLTKPADFSPEFQLLIASAPYPLQPEEGLRLAKFCDAVRNWKAVLKLVKRHRVPATVYLNLERYAQAQVPPAVLQTLRDKYERAKTRTRTLAAEFLRIRQACNTQALPIWLLKGPTLAEELFGEMALRSTRDLDILAPPDRIQMAEEIIFSLGYQAHLPARPLQPRQWQAFKALNHHSTYYHPEKGIKLELHWSLANAFLMPPAAVCQMQARARTLTQADLPLSVLSREDTLAYLLVHGAKHKWATLKLVLDLDVVVRNQLPVDWEAFTHIMMELQLQRPLVQGFGLAQRVFATPIPGPVRRIMDEQPGAAYLVESAYRALLADKDYLKVAGPFTEFKQALYMAQLRPGWRYRISFLTSFLLHSLNDWNDYPLPDSLFVLYYLMRPFTWVWRYFIRRAVRSNLVA